MFMYTLAHIAKVVFLSFMKLQLNACAYNSVASQTFMALIYLQTAAVASLDYC